MARIYISYSSKDSKIVQKVIKVLRSAGHEVWIDRDAINAGDAWLPLSERAIQDANIFMVFLSTASNTSENVIREVELASRMQKRIIPVILEHGTWWRDYTSREAPAASPLELVDLARSFEAGVEELLAKLGGPGRESSKGERPKMEETGDEMFEEERPWIDEGEGSSDDDGEADDADEDDELLDDLAPDMAFPLPPPPPPVSGGPGGRRSAGSEPSPILVPANGGGARGGHGMGSGRGPGRERPKAKSAKKRAKPPRDVSPRPTVPRKDPVRPRPRYANVVLLEAVGRSVLKPSASIKRASLFRLRLDIGRLSRLSAVRSPVPVPDKLLPRDIWLDVMVTSTDFEVSGIRKELDGSSVAQGRFFLPGDGGPAYTEAGKKFMYFTLRAPAQNGPARARIGYYYRNHLVQSQLLTAKIGGGASRFSVTTDYTLSESLTGLERLPRRRQVSILTNDNGNGSHQFVVRAENAEGNLLGAPITFALNTDALGTIIEEMRVKMRREPIAPTQRRRSKNQLKADLKALAPLGRQLYTEVVGKYYDKLYPLLRKDNLVVQVTRPDSSRFVFPWGMIYDIPLQSDVDWKYCSLVEEWDGKSTDWIPEDAKQCPKGKHAPNTLCPFGFWGYRHAIEQLSRTDEPVRKICPPPGFEMVMAETLYNISPRDLQEHAKAMRGLLADAFPSAALIEGNDVTSIRSLLAKDTPLIYFYCHGERPNVGSPDTYLGVGRNQKITSGDFIGWVQEWWEDSQKKVWDQVRPLIFVNACHSLDISPNSLVTYLDAFLGTGHAAGVIGTEVRVAQPLAMEAAVEFFRYFLKKESVGRALHKVRMSFLREGNLFGLVYTPYCWSDLKIVKG